MQLAEYYQIYKYNTVAPYAGAWIETMCFVYYTAKIQVAPYAEMVIKASFVLYNMTHHFLSLFRNGVSLK